MLRVVSDVLLHLYKQLNAAVDSTSLLIFLCTWLVVFLTYKVILRPLYFSPLRVMPSLEFIPILGQFWELSHKPANQPYLRGALELGPIFRYFNTFGRERVFVGDPDALKHILVTNHANYEKPPFFQRAFAAIGEKGLLVVTGKEHAMHRKILNPAFKRENLKGMVQSFQELTGVLVQCWEEKLQSATDADGFVEIPVHEDLPRLTLDIIGKCAFGYEFNSIREPDNLVSQSMKKLLRGDGARSAVVMGGIPHSLRRFLPTAEFSKKLAFCYKQVDDIITERKLLRGSPYEDGAEVPNDLLSLVMQARDKDTGEGLPEEVIRNEVMTFMLAGHETTSAGLTWILLELARHPEIQDRLRSEVRAVLPGDDTPITWDLLDQIPYLMWVVKEALRFHPPGQMTYRQPIKDDRLGPYHIPAGTLITISPLVLHRLPQYWEDPDTFNPERFASDSGRNAFTFLPFIAGPRTCIGSKFALAEMRAVTAVLVQHFQFHLVPGVVVCQSNWTTVMRPDPPLCLRVSKAPC